MPHTSMTGRVITINIDQIVGIGEFNLTGKARHDPCMRRSIGLEILEVIGEHIKILDDRITEEHIDVTTGMKATAEREAGVGLEKGHFQEIMAAIIEGMIEIQVIVDQCQNQEQARIGIELDVISGESMITFQKIVPPPMKKSK